MSTTCPLAEPTISAGVSAATTTDDRRRWRALPFLLGGYLTVFAAVTMLNVALPDAQADLGLSNSSRQWVLTIYSLTFGGLHLLGGRIADTIGLRRTVLIGLVGFAGAALLGGLATSGAMLLVARTAQGAAGALVSPASIGLLSTMFGSGRARAKAFGALGTVMGLGTAGSFVVGGWLTDSLSWRWCMLVNVPVVLVAAGGLARLAPADAAASGRRVDIVGAVTITAAVAVLVLGFDRATKHGWRDEWTIGMLVAGVALFVVFVVGLARSHQPLIPLRLVANRTRGAGLLAVFTLATGMFFGFFLITVYLQDVLGYSAMRTGLAFVPFGLSSMAGSRFLTRWSPRMPAAPFLVGGLGSLAAGLALLSQLSSSSTLWTGVVPPMLLLGIGNAAVMVTAQNMMTQGAGADSGVAGAAAGAVQQIGAALGTALLGSIAASATADRYGAAGAADRTSPEWIDALVHGFTRASTVGALILVAGALTAVTLSRGRD